MKSRILVLLPISLLALMALSFVPMARADNGSNQAWQIEISVSCNNPTYCLPPAAPGTGGIWEQAELSSDGAGYATETGCGHLGGSPVGLGLTPPYGGAGHTNVQILGWTIDPTTHDFVVTGETDTFVGHGTPVTITISSEYSDSGTPAAPGHYSFSPFPGVSVQIQVVQLS